jgi:hypothetical protein
MRGLGIAALLTDDSARRGRVLSQWKRQLTNALSADLDVVEPLSGVSERTTSRSAGGVAG